MANPNLYTCNLKAKHEWYDDWQVKKRLKPYIEYLDLVKKHYKKTEIILDYKRRPPQTNSRDYKRRPPQTNSPCWINLGELKDNELRQIYDTDIEHVYEFNPDRDAKNKFKSENKIKIIKRRAKQKALQLEREPSKPQLVIRRDFYQIQKQIDAAWTLLGKPTGEYMPLLKLFHKFNVEWPAVDEQDIDEWFILNREADGVLEQREFVKKALGTPDFAFLEGPPGSGKTTVLCELILQLVSRGKRVLFCASTHVAVDNLLERLVDENAKPAADLIPLRIGLSDKISEKTEHYKHDEFVKTVKNKLTRHLSGQKPASRSQKALLNVLEGNDDTIGQIARDCANLVCGTTIGILGHPDIKNGSLRRFDVMIIDEASKTTLQEFLVPALHANRWIIAGDNKQLDPYTDDKEIAVQVDSCIEKELGEVCLDVFMANRRRHATIVVTNDEDLKDRYLRQCEKFGVKLHDADTSGVEIDFGSDQIVIGSPTSISRLGPPGQYATIRNCDQLLNRPKQEKKQLQIGAMETQMQRTEP